MTFGHVQGGMPVSFVSKNESGERRLDLPELREVCQVIEISLEILVKRFERGLGKRE